MLALALVPGAALCNGQATKSTGETGATIVANIEEVSLDLVVRDKKGRPVRDLKPEDIEIRDDGSVVKLNGLRLISGSEEQPESASAKADALRNLHLVTFVFERLGPDAGRLAREAAYEMVKAAAGERIYFAILQNHHRLRLVQEYTSDSALVEKAIDASVGGAKRGSGGADSDAAESALRGLAHSPQGMQQVRAGDLSQLPGIGPERAMAQMMLNTLQSSEQSAREEQARPSLDGLLIVARHQSILPGRKTVVYFSEGLRVTMATKDLLRSIIGAANRGNVSIYTVDASGLSVAAKNDAARQLAASAAQSSMNTTGAVTTAVSAPGGGSGPGRVGSLQPNGVTLDQATGFDRLEQGVHESAQAPLMELAVSTGGFFVGDSNDLRKPARLLMQDVENYYQASYVPAIQQYDGRFRSLRVKARRPGLKIQARAGYFALPPSAGPTVEPFEAPMLKALGEPALPNDFEFRSQVVRFGYGPDGVTGSVVMELPLKNLEFREDGTSKLFGVHFSVLALIKSKSGEVIHKFSQDIPYQGALEAAPRAREGMFTFQRHFTLEPGEFTLESVLLDNNSGKMSAHRSSFKISDVPGSVRLSDIAMVRRLDVFPADADPAEPFQYQNHKIVPNLAGFFSRDSTDVLSAFFVIYPGAGEKPQLQLELLREGEPLGSVPMEMPQAATAAPIPYIASIPTGSLRPGHYELRATIAQGKDTAEQAMPFVVEGTDVAAVSQPAAGASSENSEPAEGVSQPKGGEDPAPSLPEASRRARFAISSLKDAALRPEPAEVKRILDFARQRAVDYTETLPNFTCIEVTRRSADPTGQEHWRAKDSITELLRYQEKTEQRTTLTMNGQRSQISRMKMQGTLSSGEFGVLLKAVFHPSAKAEFEWKEKVAIDNHPVHVFFYRVDVHNSKYLLIATGSSQQLITGFHGLVYIDAATFGVRRISLIADGIPVKFPLRESEITVDYDYVAIGDHDYLVPVQAEVRTRQGKRYLIKNELEFRDYKKYGAASSITFGEPE